MPSHATLRARLGVTAAYRSSPVWRPHAIAPALTVDRRHAAPLTRHRRDPQPRTPARPRSDDPTATPPIADVTHHARAMHRAQPADARHQVLNEAAARRASRTSTAPPARARSTAPAWCASSSGTLGPPLAAAQRRRAVPLGAAHQAQPAAPGRPDLHRQRLHLPRRDLRRSPPAGGSRRTPAPTSSKQRIYQRPLRLRPACSSFTTTTDSAATA